MILRERRTERGLLVSVCDRDVLGKTFENGDVSITVSESFYGGAEADDADEPTVVKSLDRARVANIVGDRAVEVAVDAGIIDEGHVLEIGATRHAQLVRL